MVLSRPYIVPGSQPDAIIRNRADLYNYVMSLDRPPAVRLLVLGSAERRIRERVHELERARDDLSQQLNMASGARHRVLYRINEIQEHLRNEDLIVDECFSASDLDLLLESAEQLLTLAVTESILEELDSKIDTVSDEIINKINVVANEAARVIVNENRKSSSEWQFWRGTTIGMSGNFFFGLLLIFAAWFVARSEGVSLRGIVDLILGPMK